MDNKPSIAWKVGDVSSAKPPRTVLTGMRTCANCHSFTPDGKTLAMDLDFGTDKGAYAIAPIGQEVKIGRTELITWNDYRREDGQETLGFFSTISPNGRYVVSTVKETIVLKFLPDPNCSQIFFPIRGILALYDRETRRFQSLREETTPPSSRRTPRSVPMGELSFSPGRWFLRTYLGVLRWKEVSPPP
jgi:hypothetical protein